MRLCLIIVSLVLLLPGGVMAQNNGEPYSISVVKNWMQEYARGFSSSFAEKNVKRLGDRASIVIIKIFEEEQLKEIKSARIFLALIRSSFLDPRLISIAEDREPRVTLLLLKYLEREVADEKLREEIFQIEEFIKQKTSPHKEIQGSVPK